jgi:hypothetical protein
MSGRANIGWGNYYYSSVECGLKKDKCETIRSLGNQLFKHQIVLFFGAILLTVAVVGWIVAARKARRYKRALDSQHERRVENRDDERINRQTSEQSLPTYTDSANIQSALYPYNDLTKINRC